MAGDWEARLETIREREGVSSRWVIGIGVGTALFLAASLGGLWLFYAAVAKAGPWVAASQFPAPRLESDGAGDLRDLLKSQTAQLHEYAWVDREHGRIRVPIERALQIVAARGDAAYEPPAGAASDTAVPDAKGPGQ